MASVLTEKVNRFPAKLPPGSKSGSYGGGSNVIGGIAGDDPWRTSAQIAQSGQTTHCDDGRRSNSLKKTIEPEFLVSPITGQRIGDYGTWAGKALPSIHSF